MENIKKFRLATLSWLASIWMASVGNIVLWLRIWDTAELSTAGKLKISCLLAALLMAVLMMIFSVVSWRGVWKPICALLLLFTAGASYFMYQYGIVIDSSMVDNAMQTDLHEVRGLLNWQLLFALIIIAALPLVLIVRLKAASVPFIQQLKQNCTQFLLALLVAAASVWLGYQDLASLMRNDKALRFTINPLNSIYATSLLLTQTLNPERHLPLQAVGLDAQLAADQRPGYIASEQSAPLFIFIVGETARADHFSIAGYPRYTSPNLSQLQKDAGLVFFNQVASCGTNTQVSVPCMMSHLTRTNGGDKTPNFESLPDVLARAGLAVLWIDNQSGCKGVCDRVPHASTFASGDTEFCGKDGKSDCQDGIMLKNLEQRIAELAPEKRAKGTVIFMHQMGSHGPEYYLRSAASDKKFLPECTTNALPNCKPAELINAYDNSIVATDNFIHQVWSWLQKRGPAQATGLWYVSDHGESLGENGVYLHGMPYVIAPEAQKHVPMAIWLSSALQASIALPSDCLSALAQSALTHDNIYATVLGLLKVKTEVRDAALDMTQTCRRAARN